MRMHITILLMLSLAGIDDEAFARGGRGGGPGRAGPSRRGGRINRQQRTEEQRRDRAAERLRRVEAARIAYAKRERQQLWDTEAVERNLEAVRRVLDAMTGH